MAAERSVDPRFDPRFQRGYEHATAPTTAVASTVTASEPAVATAPAAEAAEPEAAPSAPIRGALVPDAGEAREDTAAEDFPESAFVPRRNPFRLALLFASLGLIAAALATMWWVATHPSQFLWGSAVESAGGWMVQQLTNVGPPAALIAGLVGLGAWLALGALESLERAAVAHPEPDDDDD